MALPPSLTWWIAALAAAILWPVSVAVYRVYFHPLSLAQIPGPKLAALTYLYRTYFNVTGGSRYFAQIEKLHGEYGESSGATRPPPPSAPWPMLIVARAELAGPVVRIGPNEVHLSDSDNYEKIYYIGTKFSKSPPFYGAFGSGASAFSTPSNKVHRVRRAALNPLFSRKKVLELEAVVQDKAKKLVDRVVSAAPTHAPVNLHDGFRAVSVDTITDYAFDACYNLLDREDFGTDFMADVRALGPAVWFFQQWPFLQSVARGMPNWLAAKLSKPLGSFTRMQEDCRKQIVTIKENLDSGEKKPVTRTTIFHQLLNPNATEGHIVPSVDDLKDEAYVMLSAAADTTGNAMTIAAYHVIENEDIYKKLTAELKEAFPDSSKALDFLSLEKLPYLTAVIKEGLRLAYCELYVTLGTLFRRCDDLKVYETGLEDLTYEDYFASYHPLDARRFHVISAA
ncbi:MAG: hypothetical protein M1838_001623 [Thelocarpon superellum]|nr:MAG: hypothetical protein M1838_001623 [Thelocarpon superellum]